MISWGIELIYSLKVAQYWKRNLATILYLRVTFLCFRIQNSSQVDTKEKAMKKIDGQLEMLEGKSKQDSEGVTEAQNHYHAVSAGLSSNDDGEDKTLADQLMGKFSEVYHEIERERT